MMAWMACFKWLCFRWFLYGFVCGFVWLWLLGEGGEGMSAFHLYQYMPFRPARGIQRIMVHPVCYWNRVFLYGYGFFYYFSWLCMAMITGWGWRGDVGSPPIPVYAFQTGTGYSTYNGAPCVLLKSIIPLFLPIKQDAVSWHGRCHCIYWVG